MKTYKLLVPLVVIAILFGCGGGKDNKKTWKDDDSGGAIGLRLNLSGSSGLVVTDGSGETAALKHARNADYLGLELPPISVTFATADNDSTNLQNIDSSGNLEDALNYDQSEDMADFTHRQPPPKVRTVGIAPTGEVYFHFEYNFIYRTRDDSGARCENPWEVDSPCNCQIFRSTKSLLELTSLEATPDMGTLECIDYEHSIAWWNTVSDVFQFDQAGNMYFQGQLPEALGSVLYKVSRAKVDGKFVLTEFVNANICVYNYRVTPKGGLFYVGQNCIDGNWSGDGAFFRYVSPAGTLIEIGRNWWDYNFELLANSTDDKVLFFGPDPDSTAIPEWDAACLYEFNPSAPQGQRATKLIECNQNLWGWLWMDRAIDKATFGAYEQWDYPPQAWRTEFFNRCLTDGETFIGGLSHNPLRGIYQNSTGGIYLLGDQSIKNKGSASCSAEMKGPHCVIGNVPAIRNGAGTYTEVSCLADGGTWKANGYCEDPERQFFPDKASCDADANAVWRYDEWPTIYWDVSYNPNVDMTGTGNIQGHICLEPGVQKDTSGLWTTWENWDGTTDSTVQRMQYTGCTEPTEGWTTNYKGFAEVNRTTGRLSLLSGLDEQVADMWIVNDLIYFTAYKNGEYVFSQEYKDAANKVLLSNFEVYNVSSSPRSGNLVLFDGLNFDNNSYTFGDLDPLATDVEASIQMTKGLTGRVKTIVIYGDE